VATLPKNCGIESNENTFHNVFKHWLTVSEDYARAWKNGIDFHWSYRERAHISMLAAAVWASGGVALEEYGTKKDREKDPYSGHCDLCFKLGKSPDDQGYVAEAKHLHVDISTLLTKPRGAQEELSAAMDAARVTCAEDGEIELSIVFATFRVPKKAKGDQPDPQIPQCIRAIQQLHSGLKCHTIFWQFPEWATDPSDDFYLYPGTAVFIKLK
jgi:hypothetical protein